MLSFAARATARRVCAQLGGTPAGSATLNASALGSQQKMSCAAAAAVNAVRSAGFATSCTAASASRGVFGVAGASSRAQAQSCAAAAFRRGSHAVRGFASSRAAASEAAAPAPTGMAAILAFPKTHPFATNIIIATLKTSLADVITQVGIEGKSEIDWKRNFVFVVFGAVYLGGFQWWIQVTCYRKWFPTMDRFANQSFAAKLKDTPGIIDAAKQVGFDVLIHLPFMYFPTFYVFKEGVMGSSWNPADWFTCGLTKWANNFSVDFPTMFSVWFPADCFIFAVPMWLRLPVRHVVSLGWTSYLSFARGSASK